MLFHSSRIWLAFYPDLESPESEKLTDSVSEKEEKDVDEKEEMEKESHFKQRQNKQPCHKTTEKKRGIKTIFTTRMGETWGMWDKDC